MAAMVRETKSSNDLSRLAKKSYTVSEVGKILADTKAIFIQHPDVEEIINHFRLEFEIGRHKNIGGRSTTNSITVLEGDTRWGKSFLVENFIQSTALPEGGIFLHVELPASCSAKTMTVAFLEALNDPLASKVDSTGGQNTGRIIKVMQQKNVRMLFVDEYQQSFSKDRTYLVQESKDWIKSLISATRIPVVLIGLDGMFDVIKSDPQLVARTERRFKLRPFIWKEEKDIFKDILKKYEAKINVFSEPSNLHSDDFAKRIFKQSEGKVGLAAKLIGAAMRHALLREDGPDCIIIEDFANAVRSMNLTAANPFEVEEPSDKPVT